MRNQHNVAYDKIGGKIDNCVHLSKPRDIILIMQRSQLNNNTVSTLNVIYSSRQLIFIKLL